jgi:copper resistance protein B
MRNRFIAALAALAALQATAQETPADGHAAHSHDAPPAATEPPAHEHGAHAHAADSPAPPSDADRAAAFPDVSGMPAMAMSTMNPLVSLVTVERLEAQDTSEGTLTSWHVNASIGRDLAKLWIRTEGERLGGATERADLEVLWGHSVSPWWDVVAGARRDLDPGAPRTLAAVGIQGTAPLRIGLAATLYAAEGGVAAARAEAHYEVRVTNRVILQPRVEMNWASTGDASRAEGAGLTSADLGVRVRFEIRREVAPYVGLEHARRFGGTADAARAAGEDASDTRLVAGIRLWF